MYNTNTVTATRELHITRGEIYYADLSGNIGSEQGGIRPVLIIQNDIGNKFSPTVITVPITSRQHKSKLPTHIDITADNSGLPKNSIALFEQPRVIDKRRLLNKVGKVDDNIINKANNAILISFGLPVAYV